MFAKARARLADVATIERLLEGAERIALERGAPRPAAEHLVLAALELPDGTAQRTLERLGRTPGAFAAALDDQEGDDLRHVGVDAPREAIDARLPSPVTPTGPYRSEPSAQQLFQLAGGDARGHGEPLAGAHVLRAAAGLEHGVVARALRRMDVDREQLHAVATAELARRRT